ncbi:hypothetical protein GCM10007916_37450 [Psychromonas marina]|uniref:Uncharacterized protein n=1 Tax=Psychromonas marina TaxID=88364 RepID=A0ABQ6E5I1_9GAMM|nr:hypothetical protein [Psychromonas marina]GLS92673.1 hypothetical protein GCM10007916_37450 [Psychromonas marina]
MFKLFFIYPIILLIVVWLASDVEVGASLYAFEDNHLSVEFPKANLRSEENPDPWLSFYWNAESARDGLQEINDAVVK